MWSASLEEEEGPGCIGRHLRMFLKVAEDEGKDTRVQLR
jgi:hypothetical protein